MAVHGDRYDYSSVNYVNSIFKVTIICRDHGPFSQTPGSHLANVGCPDCAGNQPLTTETFIEKAIAIHGDRYDYSSVNYVNSISKVTIICPDHGPFSQTPGSHLANAGCPDCGGRKPLTTETFIEKAKAVHGDRYDYSSVNYVDAHTRVTIICPDHGPFSQVPDAHLNKAAGCPDCAGNKPLTTETFIKRAIAVHGDRYDYSSVNYVSNNTKVTIICPTHGAFEQRPADHALAKHGCPDCAGKNTTTESFIEKARAIHGDRYDYLQVNYVNNNTKVTIICRDHGPFQQTPSNHLSKQGCPDCAESGFNSNEPGLLYYVAVTTDNGDTRYKIGITNRTVEERFYGPELARIRIVKTWRYAIGRSAEEREAEILSQNVGDRYYGPDILLSGNSELFTHDILGLDRRDKKNA